MNDPTIRRYDSLNRYVKWKKERKDCNGKFRHAICLFSIEDLPELVLKPHFLVNKLMLEYDPLSYQCMEEWYEYRKGKNFHLNMFFYCKFLQSRSIIANCANISWDIGIHSVPLI
ncbi:beta-1-3-galactosyl-O-glycosyl-glyco beta-1-6-N-acetylglucosaminyltransferase-like [Brachionus plicatilis]|uniref:Beta-1-3-galactosyl-O-glycosyl-glyco beta-1-6-N-acetylglucosaminyltransferase-like n=1 Tax=Brachionus plicatilis TaxID=10195 RepID=A0A3M7SNX4_BRAPC|nr:beta-1-3-galactosyl-O-glycosyl-glyco beta-1-6-N-acetylglucosaminyltransferase-like [Brachionus plicatilis]